MKSRREVPNANASASAELGLLHFMYLGRKERAMNPHLNELHVPRFDTMATLRSHSATHLSSLRYRRRANLLLLHHSITYLQRESLGPSAL